MGDSSDAEGEGPGPSMPPARRRNASWRSQVVLGEQPCSIQERWLVVENW